MAKRIILIIVWTAVFVFGSAFLLGMVAAIIFGRQTSGGGQIDRHTAAVIGTFFAWVPPIIGLIGLLLGIFGKLPGTRRRLEVADKQ
ncbi:MAG TPA: hypothetical protein VHG89_02925 [Verrucomicrobiae bacterium]|nr:hypothetical protein [Verrucomicrobiae bacterium]